jgi:3-carboxy-cis,cis-muconate cycloisomerase
VNKNGTTLSESATPPPGGLFDGVLARGEVRGILADAGWLQAMLDAEAALCRAQVDAGLFPAAYADAIAAECRAERFDPAVIGADAVSSGNPVIPLVRALTANVRRAHGERPAGWVHHGATSQDISDTAAMLLSRRALLVIAAELTACAERCAALARQHQHTVLAGRTLLQQALPTTFGLKAAGWGHALDEVAGEVRRVAAGLPAQLGGAAGTLASLGDHGLSVLAAYAARLGLPEPLLPWHSHRLPVLRTAGVCGLAGAVAGKVAGDVVLLAQTEVGEVHDGAPARGGSSTLPHKQNPVAAVGVLAATGQIPGLLASLHAAAGHEHERAAGSWQAEWAPLQALLVATGSAASWLRDCLDTLEVDVDRMRTNLELTHGLLLAERIATHLTPSLGRLAAHDLVEAAARTAIATGRDLFDVVVADRQIGALLDAATLRRLLDPAGYLGSAPRLVERALQHHEENR